MSGTKFLFNDIFSLQCLLKKADYKCTWKTDQISFYGALGIGTVSITSCCENVIFCISQPVCFSAAKKDKKSSANKGGQRSSKTKQTTVELKEVENDYEHIRLKIDKFVNRISRRGLDCIDQFNCFLIYQS